jgi:hypothetical protein
MFRLIFSSVLVSTLVACGPSNLSPTITIENDATLTKRTGKWYLTAPVRITIPPDVAEWKLQADVKEKTFGFLSSSMPTYTFPGAPTMFEVPLETRGDLQQGVTTTLELTVVVHAWDRGLETATGFSTRKWDFMPR